MSRNANRAKREVEGSTTSEPRKKMEGERQRSAVTMYRERENPSRHNLISTRETTGTHSKACVCVCMCRGRGHGGGEIQTSDVSHNH